MDTFLTIIRAHRAKVIVIAVTVIILATIPLTRRESLILETEQKTSDPAPQHKTQPRQLASEEERERLEMALTASAPVSERLVALSELGRVSNSGIASLMEWVGSEWELSKEDSLYDATVVNNAMNILTSVDPTPVDLEGVLISIAENPRQTETMRDYAYQHLASTYESIRRSSLITEDSRNPRLKSIRDALLKPVREIEEPYIGAAAIGMNRILKGQSNKKTSEFSSSITRALDGTRLTTYSQATLLGIEAEWDPERAVQRSRVMAMDVSIVTPVRVVAFSILKNHDENIESSGFADAIEDGLSDPRLQRAWAP